MKHPFISIVIANYNYGRFLDKAIRSVIAQEMCEEIELIICDGGSNDNSVDVIRKYAGCLPPNTSRFTWEQPQSFQGSPAPKLASSIITWWCSEKDKGQSDAFNKGFSHASGRFLTWLNADDVLLPGAVLALKNASEKHPNVDWFGGGAIYFDGETGLGFRKSVLPNTLIQRLLKVPSWCRVDAPSTFFDRRLFEQSRKLDISLGYVMDIDLWMQFCEMGKALCHINQYVWGFRLHQESKTSSAMVENVRKNRFEEERIEIRMRHSISKIAYKFAIMRKRLACIVDCSYLRRLLSRQKYRMDIEK